MTDLTTCRVVRDRDGDLWLRGCDSDDLWTANTNYPDVFLTTDEVLTVFGPLAPVLDADGLPVVHTVGDLTARHVGRQVIVDGLHAILGTLPWQDPDGVWRVGLNGYGEVCSLDTPCEVLA